MQYDPTRAPDDTKLRELVLFIAQRLGYRCVKVPVRWDNVEGTKVSLWLGLRAFLDLLEVRWNGITGKYR